MIERLTTAALALVLFALPGGVVLTFAALIARGWWRERKTREAERAVVAVVERGERCAERDAGG